MSSAENALMGAIYKRLLLDAGLSALIGPDAIFDRLLNRPRLPAIVFGECETRDYSTSTDVGYEHFLTIEIWSEAHGRKTLQTIEAQVNALLHDRDLNLPSFTLVNLRRQSTRVRRVARTGYFLAEMRFRAVTEPA